MLPNSTISISNFVDKELVLFSCADNVRSLGSAIDGLKPSQRKVLYACLKRKLSSEIKVAQLAGYVSEHAAYHHGEMSLQGTIVAMAQNFVGSNNIPLLFHPGNLGLAYKVARIVQVQGTYLQGFKKLRE